MLRGHNAQHLFMLVSDSEGGEDWIIMNLYPGKCIVIKHGDLIHFYCYVNLGCYFEIWLADMLFNIILPMHTKRNIIPCIQGGKTK